MFIYIIKYENSKKELKRTSCIGYRKKESAEKFVKEHNEDKTTNWKAYVDEIIIRD